MKRSVEIRQQCAQALQAKAASVAGLRAFVGLDGFVDEIIHVVDKRHTADEYLRLRSLGQFAERVAAAAGKGTNLEVVTQTIKLGGNGPILADALATFGLEVIYLGALGYPAIHPVFESFAKRAEVHSIAEPGHTDALEFDDGKLMLGKTAQLKEINWANIQARFGREKFAAHFSSAQLVAFVNWTMIPHMSDLLEVWQLEICPGLKGPRRLIFFDLADPEKRLFNDISRALDLIVRFERNFSVILGLNEKEAYAISQVLGLAPKPRTVDGLSALAREIVHRLPIDSLVIHPAKYALAARGTEVQMVHGPYLEKPLITTGAGDHFNAGFCLGKLLGFDDVFSLMTGVATSGLYVRTAHSPSFGELIQFLVDWSAKPLTFH